MTVRRLASATLLLLGLVVGVVAAPPASALDNGLARTPYLGWNTYYGLGSSFDEATIDSVADAMVNRGLSSAGYRYVWIDGGWWSGTRDAQGNITVDPAQWPHGMKAVADYIHSKGLLAGIYTDAGTDGCGGANQGSYGHYQQDADQFAAWGFDALKVDFCGGTFLHLDPATAYRQFRDALLSNAGHRPMLFNICNPFTPDRLGPGDPPLERSAYYSYTFGPSTGNSWRTDTDVGFVHSVQWPDVLRNLDDDAKHPEAAGPGHWNDPDYLGPELGMTAAQAQAQFTMWSMVAAPLIVGSDVRALSPATIGMLTNRDVLAIDQDQLGVQGTRISQQGNGDVWVKPLANGDRAITLLNRGSAPLTIRTSTDAAGLPRASRYTLHDLWNGRMSETAGTITTTVPPQSAVLYRATRGAGDVEPATDLSAPSVPATPGSDLNLALPGSALAVSAVFRNDGREPVTQARIALTAPPGWTVTGDTGSRTVPTGASITGRWQVSAPPGALPGRYSLTVRADYRWDDETRAASRSADLSVLVPSAPPDGVGHLSDHAWMQASSGWQVAAPDASVGGGPITMQGVQYAKGIGVASPSRVDYYLGGNCTRLSGIAGIDDAVNNVGPEGGTASFQIAGDGQVKFDTGVIDRTATKAFDVDLTGVRVLSLLVGDGGDGGFNDRANWANLDLTCGPPPAPGTWPEFVLQSALTATATSAHDGFPASAAVDGSLTTIWHDEFTPQAPLPQALTIDLGAVRPVSGLTYQPRLDVSPTGTVTAYQVELSSDGSTFSAATSGAWPDDSSLKSVSFPGTTARYVRLVATAGDGGYASAAEVRVAVSG